MTSIPTLRTVGVPLPPGLPATGGPAGAGDASFHDVLVNSLQEVNSMQQQANTAVEALYTGQDVNPAEVLTAVQKADLAFRLLMQVRNKIVQAYDEVRSMQV
jgi:flagellar hook-basal body complex protein FliE